MMNVRKILDTTREFDLAAAEVKAIKLLDRRKFEAAVARLRSG